MATPLTEYEELLKELKVEVEDKETDLTVLLSHVRSQVEQFEAALRRELVDIIISKHQVLEATDSVMSSQHQSKVAEHELLAKQFVRTVKVLREFINELEAKVKSN